MYRNAVFDPTLHLFQQKACLGLWIDALFEVVVVVAEFCIRIHGVRPHECGVDKFRTDALVPDGLGAPHRFVVADCFVHHVPFGNFAFPVPDHVLDVVLEHLEQFLLVVPVVVHPARNLTVPGEGVTTDAHAILLGVLDHFIAVVVIEPSFLRFGRIKLHLVFGNDDVELLLMNLFVIAGKAAAKPLRVQNGADVDSVFIGKGSKGFICGEGVRESFSSFVLLLTLILMSTQCYLR